MLICFAGHIGPAGSGKRLTPDLNPVADYTFKTEIILARGGNGGGQGGGGQGGHGNGVGDGSCDGGPGPGSGDN